MPIETGDTEDAFAALLERIDAATEQGVADAAALLEGSIKAQFSGSHAKGQPHTGGDRPNVVTGTARRSVTVTGPESDGAGSWSAIVAPSVIYGRRLELGFVGTDSIGRVYTSGAKYPFVQPGYEAVAAQLEDVITQAWANAVEEG